MGKQRTFVSAFWASLVAVSVADAKAIDINDNQLQPRHYSTEQCSPTYTFTTTKIELCTVTVRETVTVQDYLTVTGTAGESYSVITSNGKTSTITPPYIFINTTTCSTAISTSANTTSTSRSIISTSANTTSSTTSSAAYTPTSCPVPSSCGNLGFNWAYYNNSARNTDTTYSSFLPDTFKGVQPIYIGTTRYVGGLYGPTGAAIPAGTIYDSSVDLRYDYFALNHHAYLYACQAGTYRVSIPYANDAVYLWIGAKAYAGWTDNNADAKALYNQPDHIAGHTIYIFSIPAAMYVPIRFFYGQAQYGGGFDFSITTPSGQVIVSNTDESSPYVVQHSCDRITAPLFPAFGSEI